MRGKEHTVLGWGVLSPSLTQSLTYDLGQIPPCLWASVSCPMQTRWPGSVFASDLLGALGWLEPQGKSGEGQKVGLKMPFFKTSFFS